MDKKLLFRITLPPSEKITNSLNNGNIPKGLREAYEKRGYPLSNDEHISIRVKKEIKVWELYDEIEESYYRIEFKHIGGKLTIYHIQKEESGVDKQKEQKGNMKSRYPEQKRARKSKSPFEINRIKALGKGKNILRSLALFIIPSILIWLGLDIFGYPPFIILIALILTMGIIAIIVGVYSGLSSKSTSSSFISGFVVAFIGSLIVILLISSSIDAPIDQEPEEPIGLDEGEENGGEFFGYLFVMGIIGGISAVFGNSITSNVNILKNYVCSNCGQEYLDYSKESHLFSILESVKDIVRNLDDEDKPIWEPLKDEYERRGYPLSDDEHISVTVVKNGEVWDLYDEIEKYNHRIRKEYGRLKVFNKNQCPNCGAKFGEIEKDTVLEEEELI